MKRHCTVCKFKGYQDKSDIPISIQCRYGPPTRTDAFRWGVFPWMATEDPSSWCYRFISSEGIEDEEEEAFSVPDQTCICSDITYEFKNGECHIYQGRKNT